MYLSPITEEEVLSINKFVCNKKSSGKDKVPCCLIKDVSNYLLTILTYLINVSFEMGSFPDQLKTALVIPVYKIKIQIV